jgi:hypothetical protein
MNAKAESGAPSYVKDEIARLRHEAKHLRELGKARREDMRKLRALPIGHKDPIEQIRVQCRINEYTIAARQRDEQIKRLRS